MPLPSPHWKNEPDEHDFPAAAHYLSLLTDHEDITRIIKRLRAAPTVTYYAKDLLRASELSLLDTKNAHVHVDFHKIQIGEKLSPVLLVRGRLGKGRSLVVADGYHRICASYWVDENEPIPCRIVDGD